MIIFKHEYKNFENNLNNNDDKKQNMIAFNYFQVTDKT